MKNESRIGIGIVYVFLLLIVGTGLIMYNLYYGKVQLEKKVIIMEQQIQQLQQLNDEKDATIESMKENTQQLYDDYGAKITNLEQQVTQWKQKYNEATTKLEEKKEIPERYKEILFDVSEIRFVTTLFRKETRVIKIDKKNNVVTDLLTDTELQLVGIHNFIENSYGYEFTMEEFLKGETAIQIDGKYYTIIEFPESLQFAAMSGQISLYDICLGLIDMEDYAGQFFYSR